MSHVKKNSALMESVKAQTHRQTGNGNLLVVVDERTDRHRARSCACPMNTLALMDISVELFGLL